MSQAASSTLRVSAFYLFVPLDDFQAMRDPLLAVAEAARVRGSILLAAEGVNGTIAGSDDGVETVLAHLRRDRRLADLSEKNARAERMPFGRLKVRLKREIVSLGVESVDPRRRVGAYERALVCRAARSGACGQVGVCVVCVCVCAGGDGARA